MEISDLYQAGCIGLIKAYRKYNENLGVDFMSFAYKYVLEKCMNLLTKVET